MFTGMSYTDFKIGSVPMTESQWVQFLEMVLPNIDQMINRYCNVTTFDCTRADALITELHDGRGANNDEFGSSQVGLMYYGLNGTTYLATDTDFYLREICYSLTSIQEDTASDNDVSFWVSRYPRGSPPTYEVDTLEIYSQASTNGNITITLNSTYTYTVAITTSMTIAQICAAIVAAGPHTDSKGVVWTPTSTAPLVNFTAGVTGVQTMVGVSSGTTGISLNVSQTSIGTSTYGGDYQLITKNETTYIHFVNNVPAAGYNNVKVVYTTGYSTTSPQYAEIKIQALRAATNFMLLKKKIQEALTIRAQGVRDYSQMFDIMNESAILTPNIKEVLDKYRRYPIEGDIYL